MDGEGNRPQMPACVASWRSDSEAERRAVAQRREYCTGCLRPGYPIPTQSSCQRWLQGVTGIPDYRSPYGPRRCLSDPGRERHVADGPTDDPPELIAIVEVGNCSSCHTVDILQDLTSATITASDIRARRGPGGGRCQTGGGRVLGRCCLCVSQLPFRKPPGSGRSPRWIDLLP